MKKLIQTAGVLALALNCTAADYSQTRQDMTAWITNQMQEHGASSLALALVDGAELVWADGFGMADPVDCIPSDPDTIYRICSVSKVFITLAAMQEADGGRLDIDAPVTNYVPDFRMLERFQGSDPITPRMLLNHQSGIPGNFVPYGDATAQDFHFADRVLAGYADEVQIFPPGFTDTYCNEGFTIMEHVFEPISGDNYISYARKNLIEPLGMNDTTFLYDTNRFDGRLARSVAGTNVYPDEVINVFASGGLYSTVRDMSRLIEMLLGNGEFRGSQILSAQALETVSTWQGTNLAVIADTKKGLGFDEVAEPSLAYAGRAYWKSGDSACFHAMLEIMPDHGLGAVVLCNGGSVAVDTAHRLLMCALRDKFGLPVPTNSVSFPDSPEVGEPPLPWNEITGFYAHSAGLASVTSDQQTLAFSVMLSDNSTYAFSNMTPHADGWFWNPDDMSLQVAFSNVQDKLFMMLRKPGSWDWSTSIGGERIEPGPIPSAWQDRAKTWIPSDMWTSSFQWPTDTVKKWHLMVTNGFLVFGRVFTPVSDTLAYPPVTGLNNDGVLKAVSTNDEEWLYLSGVHYRPLDGVPAIPTPGSTTGTLAGDITGWHRIQGGGVLELRLESTNDFQLIILDNEFNRLVPVQPQPERCLVRSTGTVYAAVTRGATSGGDYTLLALRRVPCSDYSGDGVSDLAVYNEESGAWYISCALAGEVIIRGDNWGYPSARPVPGDYDGDGISDMAVYDSGGNWYIRTTAGEILAWQAQWGFLNTDAVSGDYNGDGISDMAVYHEDSGCWFIMAPDGTLLLWGEAWGGHGFTPVSGDYDGDGISDMAVYADGYWFIKRATDLHSIINAEAWGGHGFAPVSGDYDGDGISDMAVYHEESGCWFIMAPDGTLLLWGEAWGGHGFTPVSGDYDGDGISDMAVYADGYWFIRGVDGTSILFAGTWGGEEYAPAGQ